MAGAPSTVRPAYDSNIALLLTKGADRLDSYDHLAKVLRSTTLRGSNLATDLEFHYGLVNWFLGQNVMAKPTTRFVVPYLTLVGRLKEEANKIDYVYAFLAMKKHYATLYSADPEIRKSISETLDRKGTLITRPIEKLLADPHLLAGWLSLNRKYFELQDGKLVWLRNPLVVLEETYEYLNMNWRDDAPAAEVIWTHDRDLLKYPDTSFATGFRDGERNLHFVHVNKIGKGRSCRACHEIHADSGLYKHVKQGVLFSGWNMPMNFVPVKNGGACLPGCHGERKYSR